MVRDHFTTLLSMESFQAIVAVKRALGVGAVHLPLVLIEGALGREGAEADLRYLLAAVGGLSLAYLLVVSASADNQTLA